MNASFEKKLIALVRQHQSLYFTKSRSNRNNEERMLYWRQISNELRRSVFECKQRWKSLRDRFVREKKKIDEGEAYPGDRWEYYDDLKFLSSAIKKRGPSLAIKPDRFYQKEETSGVPAIEDSYQYSETEQDVSKRFETEENIDYSSNPLFADTTPNNVPTIKRRSTFQEFEYAQELRPIKILKGTGSHINSHAPKQPKSDVNISDISDGFVSVINIIKTEIDKNLKEKDENDLFLECIAKKMKRLSERAKLRIQEKVLSIVTEELLNE